MKIRVKVTYEKPQVRLPKINSWINNLKKHYPHRYRGTILISFLFLLTVIFRFALVSPILHSYYYVSSEYTASSGNPLQRFISIEEEIASDLTSNIKGIFSHKEKKDDIIKTDVGFVDLRVVTLEEFFSFYGSPLGEYSDDFIEASERYNIENWQLLPAIAINETNGCQTGTSYHQKNCWGWGGGPQNRIVFDSLEDAIEIISYAMISSYGNERMNARDIQSTYCGQNCMEQGWKWAKGVNSYVKQINDYGEGYGLPRTNEIEEFPPI